MTIQMVHDSIAEKNKALDALIEKADPTMEDVESIKKYGDELTELKSQLATLEDAERIRKERLEAKGSPKSLEIKGEVKVKGSRLEKMTADEKKNFVVGRFLQSSFNKSEAAEKDLQELGIELKTHTEAVDSEGGIFVPNEVSNYIIDLKDSYGVFRRNARVERMGSETKTVFRMGSDVTAYWGSEAAEFTSSKMNFDAVQLTAKKLYAYSIITNELNADASIDMGRRFAETVARQFAKKEDEAGFNGDGTSTYGGVNGARNALLAVDATIGNIAGLSVASGNAYSEATIDDFVSVKRNLPQYATAGAKWYISKEAYGDTYERLVMAAGGISAVEMLNGVSNPTILGAPVEFVEVMPTTEANSQVFALYGRLDMAATMGDRQNTQISTDTSKGFSNDTIHIKATERIDINVHDVGNTTEAGPLVGLITAAS